MLIYNFDVTPHFVLACFALKPTTQLSLKWKKAKTHKKRVPYTAYGITGKKIDTSHNLIIEFKP